MKDKYFFDLRKKIRDHELVKSFSPEESGRYLKTLPDEAFSSLVLFNKKSNVPLLQPRGGFSTWQHQRDLSLDFSNAGSDFIPLTIDSHTRQNDYDRASYLLAESEDSGKNLLNGYPLVAHGVIATRNLYSGINKPVSLRHGTPDAKLLVEMALDSGITEIEGGGLCYCLPYSKAYPIDRALLNWQYVDRLCAELSSEGRLIHRESFGALTATMVPPFMVVVVQILELLLAAEQGVHSFSVSFSQSGSFEQDLATAKALRVTAAHYLNKMKYSANVYLVFHQWMGAFPAERSYADALIVNGATIASLCGADKVVIKTRNEALGIPDIDCNIDAMKMTRYAMELCSGNFNLHNPFIEEEFEAICLAANYVIDKILDSDDHLWEKISQAVSSGIIDIPFSPHQDNKNKIWTMRDERKGIRVAEQGLIPLPKDFLRREHLLLGTRLNDKSLNKSLSEILIMINNGCGNEKND